MKLHRLIAPILALALALPACAPVPPSSTVTAATVAAPTVPTPTPAPPSPAPPTTTPRKRVVVIWHGDNEAVSRVTEELIKSEFNKLHPDIEVKYQLAPDPEHFKEKLLATIPAGTGPDLFEWNHDWIGTFVKAGLLAPIDGLVTPELQARYVDSAFKAGQFDGKLYTLPISAEAAAFAYNKALLDGKSVPKTTDELVAAMKDFKQKGYYGISYPLVPFTVSGFIHAFGGLLWNDATKTLGVNSKETKTAVAWLVKTFKPYMSSDPSWDPQVVLFTEKKSPFAVNGPWMTGSWRDAKIDFGISPLPQVSEIGKVPTPYIGVKSIYMTEGARDKEAAFTFMVWATTSKQRILQRAVQLGYIPVLKEVMDLPEVQNDPVISGFAQQVALGIPMSSSPEMVAVWGPFGDALIAAFTGAKPVDQALDDAQAKIEEAITQMK